MHPERHSIVIEFKNFTMIDPDTMDLIRDLCARLNLPAEVEFTCYDMYPIYFRHYHTELDEKIQRKLIGRNRTEQHSILREMAKHVERTALLHILAIISICAKFLLGPRSFGLVRRLRECVTEAKRDVEAVTVSHAAFMNAEFFVLRHLKFQVSLTILDQKPSILVEKL